LIQAKLVVFSISVVIILGSLFYFRRWKITRPPVGVFNLLDVTIMLMGIILMPLFYLVVPEWLMSGLLILGGVGLLYMFFEGFSWSHSATWLATMLLCVANLGAFWQFGANSTALFITNDLVQVLLVIGVVNLWVQSGMKARHAAILGAALIAYDFIFTALLSMMSDLFNRLGQTPFAPMVAWQAGSGAQWVAIGLGDLLMAAVTPLVLRKAYGTNASLMAAICSLAALLSVLFLPVAMLGKTFPVMVVLGPLIVAQYLFWYWRKGKERTTHQYLSQEPIVVDGR